MVQAKKCCQPHKLSTLAPCLPYHPWSGLRTGEPTIEPESPGEMKQASEAAMRRAGGSTSAEPTIEPETAGEMRQAGEAAMRRSV